MTRLDKLIEAVEGFNRKMESGEMTCENFAEAIKAISFSMIAACFCEYMDKEFPYRKDEGK